MGTNLLFTSTAIMKIEELPESFDESVNISSPPNSSNTAPGPETDLLTAALNAHASSTPTTNDGTTPALPPALADIRHKTGAEILADLNTVPLFMTELEENDGIEALKALAYEGTPAEVAQGFKERGNESFAEKSWKDAKEFYEKGINVLLIEVRKRQAANKIRSKMKGKVAVEEEIIKRNEIVAARKKKDLEREQRKRLEAFTLAAALKARDIKTRKTAQPPEMEDAAISLVPDPADPTSTLSFPTVLLYPLHLESDFIKAFNETEPLGHHLSYILPLPWDKNGEYTPTGVECYMETVTGGLIKVGRKVPLLKVLREGNVEIVDEVIKIFVVPKAKAAAWVKEFKEKKAKEMGISG